MKGYSNDKCIPLDLYLKNKEMQEDYDRLYIERILGSDYAETELALDDAVHAEEEMQDEEQSDEREEVAAAENDAGDEAGEENRETAAPVSHDFDEDHITCYLKEVSTYPLLTQEREMELAQTIRRGQDLLVEMAEQHAGDEKIIAELHQKVQKLLSHEKSFPGVRDKILKVIMRTVERAAQDCPENPLFQELVNQARQAMESIDAAKKEMVRANLRLVLSVAKRYRGRGMSFDDLIQEGNLGLLKAVGRYDHTKGNRFSTYATWWVRQSIIRGIYDKTRTIRLPVHFIELKNLFFKVFYELLKELGREPTAREIAERANLPLDKVQMVLTLAAQPISLETPIGEDEQRLGDFIEDESAASPLDECSDRQLAEVARSLLSTLQPREEKILRLRFGLDGQPAETLEKIGKTFNVSKERIRQIEKKALRKLRNPNRQASLRTFME